MKYRNLIVFMVFIYLLFAVGSVSAAGNNTTLNTTNSSGLAATNWPCFQSDADKTGQSNHTGPQTNTTKWTFDSITVYGSAVIGKNGNIHIAGHDGVLYTFSSAGRFLWTYTTRSSIYGSPTIGSDGTIYISNWMNSTTYALNSNGTLIWKRTTGGYNFGSSPVIGSNGTVYVASNNDSNGMLHAIDSTGKVKWSYVMGKVYGTSPLIGSDGTIYMADYDGVLYALTQDGDFKWSYRLRYWLSNVNYYVNIYQNSLSMGRDGTIYVNSHNGRFISGNRDEIRPHIGVLYAITDTGTGYVEKWSYNFGEALYGVPAISSNGTVYVVSAGGLHAMNSDGDLLWSYDTVVSDAGLTSAIMGKDGAIYFGSSKGLHAINPNGTLKWTYAMGGVAGSPAISKDGTLYIGSLAGVFYAINDLAADFIMNPVKGTVLTVKFTGSTTGTVKSWKWDFGDGSTSTAQNPTHTYGKAGVYTVTLTAELKNNGTVTRIKKVVVVKQDITPPTVSNNLKSGTYNNTKYATIKAKDESNPVIYYTTDGSSPLTSSTRKKYTSSLAIDDTTVLKYAAVDSFGNWSPVYTNKYTILDVVYVQKASSYDSKTINKDIQAILDNADPGSNIIFKDQSYNNLKLVVNKKLNIISKVGTKIITNQSGSAVFLFKGSKASGSSINGFTIISDNASGILVDGADGVIISNVQVTSANGAAISVRGSDKTTIKNSKLTNSSTGIHVYNSNNTTITGNTITGNGIKGGDSRSGVYIESSQNVNISKNQISKNWYGIKTKDVSWVKIGHNTIYYNERDGILLNGHIKNSNILCNTIDANNNGIHIDGPDENLNIQSNLITNSRYLNEVEKSYSGDGLLFGPNSIYSTSLILNNNIILGNGHRDIETRYGGETIDDIVGSNWSRPGCGAPSHDLCADTCQCKKWDPEIEMVLIRTGDGTFTVQFRNGITGGIITDIPSFNVTFTTGSSSQTVRTENGTANANFDSSKLMGTVTVTAFDYTTSIPVLSQITGKIRQVMEGFTDQTGDSAGGPGGDSGSGGNGGSEDGSGTDSGSGSSSGSSSNDGTSTGTLPVGAAAAESASSDGSSPGQGGGSSSPEDSSKTVQELILYENSPVWGILAIILLILLVTGVYYRNDLRNMVEKSKK